MIFITAGLVMKFYVLWCSDLFLVNELHQLNNFDEENVNETEKGQRYKYI